MCLAHEVSIIHGIISILAFLFSKIFYVFYIFFLFIYFVSFCNASFGSSQEKGRTKKYLSLNHKHRLSFCSIFFTSSSAECFLLKKNPNFSSSSFARFFLFQTVEERGFLFSFYTSILNFDFWADKAIKH